MRGRVVGVKAWRRSIAAVVAVAAVAAAFASLPAANAAKAPIQILTVIDQTGATSYLGKADLAGVASAVTYFNNKGGIDGHKIVNTVVSDNGNPVTSASVLDKYLASNPAPTYVFAGSFSTISGALQPILSAAHILAWSFGDGNNACEFQAAAKCGGFFTLSPTAAVEVTQALGYLKAHHFKSIGIIQDLRDTSIVETQFFQQLAPKYGIKLYLQTFPASTVDLTPEMSALKSDGVPEVWSETIGPETGYVLNARAGLNWNVPITFDVSGASSTITAYVPKSEWSNQTTEQAFSDVIQTNQKRYPGIKLMLANNPSAVGTGGFGGSPLNIAAYGWEAIDLLNLVISHTHSLNEKVNQKWLERIPKKDQVTGISALSHSYKYSPSDHETTGWTPSDYSIVPLSTTNNQGFLVPSS